jgi:hypothetical protein
MSHPGKINQGRFICELCYPDIITYGEVVPGYVLARQFEFSKHPREVPPGHYAIFTTSHTCAPWCTFETEPVESSYDLFSRGEVDGWAEDDERHEDEQDHIDCVEAIEPAFKCDPVAGYWLVLACVNAGWNFQNSGMLLFWLVDRMAKLIQKHESIK